MAEPGKIFAFINGALGPFGDLAVIGVAEDGNVLASHISSSEGWAKHDIGVTGTWKHDKYAEHYPDGYEVEWIDNPTKHAGVLAALELNAAAASRETDQTKEA